MRTSPAADRTKTRAAEREPGPRSSSPARPRRVLYLTPGGIGGGPDVHVMAVASGLSALGWQPLLVHLRDGPAAARARAQGLDVHVVRQRFRGDARILLRLRNLILRTRPDIVHTHTPSGNFYGRLAARLAGRPAIVTTLHSYFRDQIPREPRIRTTGPVMARAEDWMHRWSDRVIVISDSLRRRVAARIAPRRLRVVRCGMPLVAPPSHDDIAAARRRYALPDHVKVVGTAGRLTPVKRHSLLLDCAAALPDLHLLIVGDGPLAGPLRAQAKTRGLEGRVHFTGWTTTISPLLSLMDVYVQCSDSEGFPVAVTEAMMLGRPIVSTAVGAIPELIRDGVNGLLVPRGDAPALAAAVGRLLSEPDRARRLGRAARETAARELDLRRTVAEIAAIYDEVIAERAGRSLSRRAALP